MPLRVPSSFRAQTARGYWAKSLRMCTCFCAKDIQSLRSLVQRIGIVQSRVHRFTQIREHREVSPESWVWETARGRPWLTLGGGHALSLRPQGRRKDEHTERVLRVSASGEVGGMFAFGLTRGDVGVRGRTAGNSRSLGQGWESGW
jgi:hypothetical protein